MSEAELIEAAIAVRENAHAIYSKFAVGAALLTKSGKVFVGCNCENASYGLSICAERVAIGSMVAAGERGIKRLVVAASPWAPPCGACRQFIVEFGDQIEIISVEATSAKINGRWLSGDLLPDRFQFQP